MTSSKLQDFGWQVIKNERKKFRHLLAEMTMLFQSYMNWERSAKSAETALVPQEYREIRSCLSPLHWQKTIPCERLDEWSRGFSRRLQYFSRVVTALDGGALIFDMSMLFDPEYFFRSIQQNLTLRLQNSAALSSICIMARQTVLGQELREGAQSSTISSFTFM